MSSDINSRRSPGWILGDHAKDQRSQLDARRFSSNYGMFARERFPVQFEASPVPADDGLRLYDEEHFLPSRPEAAQENPKEPVRGFESGLRVSYFQNGGLLAEGEILKQQAVKRGPTTD